jgi:hypothetical protein
LHAFCIAHARSSNANNIHHNAQGIFVYEYEINEDLRNLPIIYFSVENMQEAA